MSSSPSPGGLSDPLNGMVSLTGTVLGSTATYTCNAGYTLIGEDVIIFVARGVAGSELFVGNCLCKDLAV